VFPKKFFQNSETRPELQELIDQPSIAIIENILTDYPGAKVWVSEYYAHYHLEEAADRDIIMDHTEAPKLFEEFLVDGTTTLSETLLPMFETAERNHRCLQIFSRVELPDGTMRYIPMIDMSIPNWLITLFPGRIKNFAKELKEEFGFDIAVIKSGKSAHLIGMSLVSAEENNAFLETCLRLGKRIVDNVYQEANLRTQMGGKLRISEKRYRDGEIEAPVPQVIAII
jgi:hypothetical protein